MRQPDPASIILDIFLITNKLTRMVGAATFSDFMNNEMMQSAVAYQMMILGEAPKRLTPLADQYPDLPISTMAKTRDFLIHRYDRTSLMELWKMATEDAPVLLAQASKYVEKDPDAKH